MEVIAGGKGRGGIVVVHMTVGVVVGSGIVAGMGVLVVGFVFVVVVVVAGARVGGGIASISHAVAGLVVG